MADPIDSIVPGTRKSSKDKILSRIGNLRKTDPKLYEAFKLVIEDLDAVTIQLNPIQEVTAKAQAAQALPPPVIVFAYTFSTTAVLMSWLAPDPIGSTVFYEIRKGTTWETADFVIRTPSLSVALDPLTVGSHDYMIKTLNGLGDESVDSASLEVVVPAIATPVVTAQVIDNNVLLTWNEPVSTFLVDYYEVVKDTVVQGELSGTFLSLFESTSGTYTYGVIAYDIAGNASTEGQVSAAVDEPPDFELHSELSPDITQGTHTASYYESYDQKVYLPADLTEQYNTHFTSGGGGAPWADPQDQIDVGSGLFIQENPATANWISEEQDIGSILSNVIANASVVLETVATTSAPTWTVAMRGKDTSPVDTAWVNGYSQFFSSVRYVQIRITCDAVGAAPRDSMGSFYNPKIAIAVKNVVDGNHIACLATDAEGDVGEEGTIVMFPEHSGYAAGGGAGSGHGTKNFTDISSITLTPKDTIDQAVTAIYDFVDVANPEYFTILCFDSAGRRVDATVGWKVRGIKALA
ncbi:MAG: hypothetical protein ACXABY_28255 [Candidatus Thorarchaeota archaeon]|jgi:hypothetical protein